MSECDICNELAAIKATLADHGDKLSILLTGVGKLVAALPPSFTVDAVVFDGTNDYLSRGANLTGVASGTKGTISYWIKTTQSGFVYHFAPDTEVFNVYQNGTDLLEVYIHDSTFTDYLSVTFDAVINDGNWHHIGISVDTNFSAGNKLIVLVVDGAVKTPVFNDDPSAAFNIGYTSATNWIVGGSPAGSPSANADIAELWFSSVDYIDFTSSANVEKFRSVAGKPVDLGADGSTPTGAAPIIYLHIDDGEAAANFATNAGGGGNFTVTGTLTTASTSPSD